MQKAFKKAAWTTAIALPALLVAQGASAALVTEWGYQVDSAFSSFGPESTANGAVTGSNPNSNLDSAPSTLTWGLSGNSSIAVEPTVTDPPPLVTNGGTVPGSTFTHNNFDIEDPNNVSLENFVLANTVQLTATQPESEAGQTVTLEPSPLEFNSLFVETDNNADCVGASQSSCDDIFVMLDGNLQQTSSFELDGITYTATLDILGLTTLEDDACAEAGTGSGCIGFLTQEGQENEFTTEFSIVAEEPAEEVPEPGAMALLGLGLVGLGVARRNRR